MSETIDLKKEYYLAGGSIGCLLIHGFTGTPAELRELGNNLHSEGFSVLGIRLKGHGTTVEELEKCNYKDWIQSAIIGLNELRKQCTKVYIVGHSMGALLTLYLAENFPADRIVALSPPLTLISKASNFAFFIKHFIKYVEWEERDRSDEEKKYLMGYNKVPVSSIGEFNKLKHLVMKDLYKIKMPLLIIHSQNDETVDTKGIDILYNKISSGEKRKVYLKSSGHNITIEGEKEVVFREVIKFLK